MGIGTLSPRVKRPGNDTTLIHLQPGLTMYGAVLPPTRVFVACTWTLGMLKKVIYSKNIVYLNNQPDALIIQNYSVIKLYTSPPLSAESHENLGA
jgi:hypothetical protein